ncbi:hypothetical protein EYC80_003587 [Monilinia laxa]|uniref:Uncharacterized protein n=1 Tax=Monilinia laxa TaxID=61186 RepID=A0A5N6KKI1_MONLA|nr:hypothetical protein EYC80_003587 [Monilinia laxa]
MLPLPIIPPSINLYEILVWKAINPSFSRVRSIQISKYQSNQSALFFSSRLFSPILSLSFDPIVEDANIALLGTEFHSSISLNHRSSILHHFDFNPPALWPRGLFESESYSGLFWA